jgi:hypothetical protein
VRILYVRHDVNSHPNPATLTDLVYVKALSKMGHQVHQFDFRTTCNQVGQGRMNVDLRNFARDIKPNLVILGKCESVQPDTIRAVKNENKCKVILWYGDQRQGVVKLIVDQAKNCDLFLHTTGGDRLREYHDAIGKPSGFIPFAVDHSLCCPGLVLPEFCTDRAIFCGGEHRPGDEFQFHPERYETLCALRDAGVCKFYGCFGEPQVRGDVYIQVMRGAPAIISISGYSNLDKYISDRPIHALACGTLLVQHRTPKIETLLNFGEYLPFETPKEAVNIADSIINKYISPKAIADMRVAGLMASHRFTGEEILGEVFKMLSGNDNGKYKWYEFYR